MFDKISLQITGCNNQPVPNTFFKQQLVTSHLCVVLPGYNPPLINPLLEYTSQLLLDRNADVLQVEHEYYKIDFFKKPADERDRILSADVTAACKTVFTLRDYTQITLIGKSLGTLGLCHLLPDDRFRKAGCVWLTPLTTNQWLRARIEQYSPRSLFIIGTADNFYNPDYLAGLCESTRGKSVVIEGADHGLTIPGEVVQSLKALTRIVSAIGKFVD
jgi:predicted alpha/beta-hydrolase family hydrolase